MMQVFFTALFVDSFIRLPWLRKAEATHLSKAKALRITVKRIHTISQVSHIEGLSCTNTLQGGMIWIQRDS